MIEKQFFLTLKMMQRWMGKGFKATIDRCMWLVCESLVEENSHGATIHVKEKNGSLKT